ncbi:uncharacterized protein [Primulina eburnea]|uniref:uncharacterized protein n=1 Tax=Primulina eburnea TaxID=1245227 RepID=UPI003C6C066B
MNAHFFFKLPKNAFTTEMVQIVGDAEIRTMCKCFRNHSVITLWSQENYFTPLKDANIGVGSNPSDDTKAGPQVLNATDDNEGGTSESFGSDPIDDNHIGLDDVSIGDDEDSLDGSFHESDEDVDSESSTENDEEDEKATEFWYSDIEVDDELISLASSDDEEACRKHHFFSDRMNMKRALQEFKAGEEKQMHPRVLEQFLIWAQLLPRVKEQQLHLQYHNINHCLQART